MSTSPETNAATRVAGLASGLKVTVSRLCSTLSHQSGFFSSVAVASARRDFSLKGPVPLALVLAYVACWLARLVAWVTLFVSAHFFDIISQPRNSNGRIGFEPLVMKSTVKSSTFFTSATEASTPARAEPGPRVRATVKITSSAVKGEPSWNFTSFRSVKRQVSGPVEAQDVASAPSSFMSRLRRTSGS